MSWSSSRSNHYKLNKPPPFLQLSKDTIQNYDTQGLDIENVLSVWMGLTKCSSYIKDGKRLENISWRIVNRNMIEKTNQSNHDQPKNKLNDGDLLSLLSIVADQNLINPLNKPQLIRKKSSNSKLIRNNSKNSLKSIDSIENITTKQRPNLFKKNSSSRSLKKLNNKSKKSNIDLSNFDQQQQQQSIKIEHDSDLFEQPNPKYAFGVIQATNNDLITENNKPQAPPLTRSDTSTSVVRGFSPYHISVAQLTNSSNSQSSTNNSSPKKQQQQQHQPQHSAPSLFNNQNIKNPQPKRPQSAIITSSTKSLFNNNQNSSTNSIQSDRIKSPLSQDTTHDVLKGDSKQQSSKQKTGTLFDHSALHEFNQVQQKPIKSEINQQKPIKSSLFEQVGISPEISKNSNILQSNQSPIHHQQQQHKKRNNVLNNLGMTSLADKQHQIQRKDKNNMFFIESSPSPTDPSKLIDHQVQQQHQQQLPQARQRSKSRRRHRHKRSSSSDSKNSKRDSLQDSISSLANSEISEKDEDQLNKIEEQSINNNQNNNTSLFADKKPIAREIIFSSDDSLSDESDWSSVSESEGELSDDYDEQDLKNQWNSNFQRDDHLLKPQIKRSLLSGLFLNEMNEQKPIPKHQQPQPQQWKSQNQNHDVDLSTSASSSNLIVKHRHKPPSIHNQTTSNINNNIQDNNDLNDDVLEISSTEPHCVISTSNVNVSGQVGETNFHNDQSLLRDKLTGSQQQNDSNVQPSSSITKMISNSALNLTNYFASRRKNSFSSIASDRTRTKYRHESNAPPTASTLLPTALSTHMFLPNAHQKRAKSKLSSVMEMESGTTSSNDVSRKNSTTQEQVNESTLNDDQMGKSPIVPINNKPKFNVEIDGLQNSSEQIDFNISRKLSPKTTRRQMLATELSDSMRKSILWDRKNGLPNGLPSGLSNGLSKNSKNSKKSKDKKLQNSESNDVKNNDDDDNEDNDQINNESITEFVQDPTDPNKPKIIRSKIKNFDNDEWDSSGTDFYTRGW
ncbi:hypothetical protein BN7_4760 [Wickerhamomyces ciferrii]|uniref:Nitrogen regulatory protein areA GATA-like domain-containing protein n=1 Tax=Wickerhamomyces ciferrii (strain ATCC 14091 / BCRC 22168 / CBS 111 / JCM 3599 / NBRC 0793 / NRRL Y-1031 F-60-10) TaxID=1206466 RepID=K0KUR9_WICCF|nr:uncharacterized protein BN7_4760 [Wickerhamomyces ciferrii]CCH45179.1 hypothetical protein BN7_4760 [Wickerhamomyces ciferrii]